MRLKHVFISKYKNLKNFSVDFTGENFMDVFVGKNGSGKSNFFEALILIFRHLYEFNDDDAIIYEFDYNLTYEIDGKDTVFEWRAGADTIKIGGMPQKKLSNIPLPDNILVYYSGQNNTITELLELYQKIFSKKVKGAEVSDIRKFIGIGGPYKELLLSLILAQPVGTKAKQFLEEKLKIKTVSSELKLILARPEYALGKVEYDISDNDDVDIRYWGAKGVSKAFLESIRDCISLDQTNRARAEGYQGSDDRYIHYYDISKLQAAVEDKGSLYLFRMLDNLKLIGMLEQVNIDIELEDGHHASISDFSDGQFQSVYIYAVTELFKESNCITLLDEPDAFLHPEWQFDFLKQIDEISEGAARTNHVLMSSHSASTISSCSNDILNVFTPGLEEKISKGDRSEVINSLSSGLIVFSEEEASLNINQALESSEGPVVFTKGVTDEIILGTAWKKLYPEVNCPFYIQSAFDRHFLRNLFSRDELRKNYPGRTMIALFDFDEAYDDWNGLKELKKGAYIEKDPFKGMCKQLICPNHYAFLLPVPNNDAIKPQVLKPDGSIWGKGIDSHLPIELLFYSEDLLEDWFEIKMKSGGGQVIEFTGDKVGFAKVIISSLPRERFESLIPIFDLIKQLPEASDSDVVAA